MQLSREVVLTNADKRLTRFANVYMSVIEKNVSKVDQSSSLCMCVCVFMGIMCIMCVYVYYVYMCVCVCPAFIVPSFVAFHAIHCQTSGSLCRLL